MNSNQNPLTIDGELSSSATSPNRRRAAFAMLAGGYANIALITVQGFVTVPLTLGAVGPGIYGAWLGSGNIIGWLGILEMGAASIIIQRVARAYGQGDKRAASDYFLTGLLTQTILVILFIFAAIVVAPFLSGWMNITGESASTLRWCFVLAAVANGLSIVNNGIAGFAQALQKTLFMNIASFVATLFGFGLTVGMLLTGWGLWALPIGLLVRNTVLLLANGIHARILHRMYIVVPGHISPLVLRDFTSLAAPALMANVGNAAMGKSDVALVAIFLTPEIATIYALTKRAAEVVMMILDRTGGAVFGGFAHLIGTGDGARARAVYHEVVYKQLTAAVSMLSIFLAFNKSFVTLWVGHQQFGGDVLSVLIGCGIVFASVSGTLGYLYGATGKIAQGAYIILLEAVVRFALVLASVRTIGIVGPPIAALITSIGSGWVYSRWTLAELGGGALKFWPKRGPTVLYSFMLMVGAYLGTFALADSWFALSGLMACAGLIVVSAALIFDARHADLKQKVYAWISFVTGG